MNLDPKAMRERFQKLSAEIASIRKMSGPLRAKRDQHVQKARAAEEEMNLKIAEVEAPLFDMDNELAGISRFLGGKTATDEAQ